MTRVTPDNLAPRKCPNKFASTPIRTFNCSIPPTLQFDIAIDSYKMTEKLFSFKMINLYFDVSIFPINSDLNLSR